MMNPKQIAIQGPNYVVSHRHKGASGEAIYCQTDIDLGFEEELQAELGGVKDNNISHY